MASTDNDPIDRRTIIGVTVFLAALVVAIVLSFLFGDRLTPVLGAAAPPIAFG